MGQRPINVFGSEKETGHLLYFSFLFLMDLPKAKPYLHNTFPPTKVLGSI